MRISVFLFHNSKLPLKAKYSVVSEDGLKLRYIDECETKSRLHQVQL